MVLSGVLMVLSRGLKGAVKESNGFVRSLYGVVIGITGAVRRPGGGIRSLSDADRGCIGAGRSLTVSFSGVNGINLPAEQSNWQYS